MIHNLSFPQLDSDNSLLPPRFRQAWKVQKSINHATLELFYFLELIVYKIIKIHQIKYDGFQFILLS